MLILAVASEFPTIETTKEFASRSPVLFNTLSRSVALPVFVLRDTTLPLPVIFIVVLEMFRIPELEDTSESTSLFPSIEQELTLRLAVVVETDTTDALPDRETLLILTSDEVPVMLKTVSVPFSVRMLSARLRVELVPLTLRIFELPFNSEEETVKLAFEPATVKTLPLPDKVPLASVNVKSELSKASTVAVPFSCKIESATLITLVEPLLSDTMFELPYKLVLLIVKLELVASTVSTAPFPLSVQVLRDKSVLVLPKDMTVSVPFSVNVQLFTWMFDKLPPVSDTMLDPPLIVVCVRLTLLVSELTMNTLPSPDSDTLLSCKALTLLEISTTLLFPFTVIVELVSDKSATNAPLNVKAD